MFCSPYEPHFNNQKEWDAVGKPRKVKICKTYVQSLWGGDIDKVNYINYIQN